jgi:hypothetical protein
MLILGLGVLDAIRNRFGQSSTEKPHQRNIAMQVESFAAERATIVQKWWLSMDRPVVGQIDRRL